MNSYTTDYYVDDNYIEFGFRADTGALVLFNVTNKDFFDTEPFLPDIEDAENKAINMAREIAGNFVDNINDYIQIEYEPQISEREKDGKVYTVAYYQITFARKVNGYFSSDYILLKITSKGHFAAMEMGDINTFKTVDFSNKTIDSVKATESISQKITEAYGKVDFDVKRHTIDIEEQRICMSPSGEVYLYSPVAIEGISKESNEMSTGVEIITLLDIKR